MAHSTVLWWSSLLEFTIQRCTQPFHQISNLCIAHMILSWSFRCRCYHIIIAACIFLYCWDIHSSSLSVQRTIRIVNQTRHIYTDRKINQFFILWEKPRFSVINSWHFTNWHLILHFFIKRNHYLNFSSDQIFSISSEKSSVKNTSSQNFLIYKTTRINHPIKYFQ